LQQFLPSRFAESVRFPRPKRETGSPRHDRIRIRVSRAHAQCLRKRKDARPRRKNGERLFAASTLDSNVGNIRAIRQRHAPLAFPRLAIALENYYRSNRTNRTPARYFRNSEPDRDSRLRFAREICFHANLFVEQRNYESRVNYYK
jgi:hypothetical protein